MSLSKKILNLFGWSAADTVAIPDKCVICIAPHTSNWDFVWGYLYKMSIGLKANFFMKKEAFGFPFGGLLRAMGGIAVDRSKKTSLTDAMAEEMKRHDVIRIGITPEGTRSHNADWKFGFYFIALKAEVPILLGSIDYAKKEVGMKKLLMPSGDLERDMQIIYDFYRDVKAKKPENFALPEVKNEK